MKNITTRYTPSHFHKLFMEHKAGGGGGGGIYFFKILPPNGEVRETTSVLLIPFTVVRQSVSYYRNNLVKNVE